MPSRARKTLFALIATLVPLVLMAVAWEIVLRLLEPPFPRNSGVLLRASDDVEKQYELIPGATGTIAGAPVTINAFGCRDRDYPVARTPGAVRIVGIGDSLTFGQGVESEETFLARLEDALAAKAPGTEVINCGVFGYNVNEEARWFAEVVELLDPDIVLIGYELGDLLANPPVKKEAVAPGESREQGRGLVQWRGLTELVRQSRVITFLAYRYSFLLKRFSLRDWDALYADESPLWRNLADKYAGMATLARSRNIDVAVAIIPELSNLDQRYPFKSVHERVAAMCRGRDMKVMDLLPAFLGRDGPRLWVHPRDRHPNAEGHRIIADAIRESLAAMVATRGAAPVAARAGTP